MLLLAVQLGCPGTPGILLALALVGGVVVLVGLTVVYQLVCEWWWRR